MARQKTEAVETAPIVIEKAKIVTLPIRIKGKTDVITHEWSRKAKWEMLTKQVHGAKCKLLSKKLIRSPFLDFAESLYWVNGKPEFLDYYLPTELSGNTDDYTRIAKKINEDNSLVLNEIERGIFGFPSGGMRAAMIEACRLVDNLAMKEMQFLLFIEDDFIVFENEDGTPAKPYMREDMVVIGAGTSDIRYRGAFKDWYATVKVSFNSNRLSAETAVNLLDLAGYGGIGEYRPSAKKTKSGNYGRFEVLRI